MWTRYYWRRRGEIQPGWSLLWRLPQAATLEQAMDAFAVLTERHEILRTSFVHGADGWPLQVVFDHAGARPPISITSPAGLAESQPRPEHPFLVGIDSDRPLWAARLVVQDGLVSTVHLLCDHLVTDGVGAGNWRDQFLALCRGEDPPPPVTQPLDRVVDEARALAGQPTDDERPDPAAMAPQILAPGRPGELDGPRYLVTSTVFLGLLGVVDRICQAHRVSRANVLMFALGWLLTRYSDCPDLCVSSYIKNRAGQDHGIECQMRVIETTVHFGAGTGAQELAGIQQETLNSYFDDLRIGPISANRRARTAAERGAGAVVPFLFNFQGDDRPGDGSEIEAARWSSEQRANPFGRPWCCTSWIRVSGDELRIDYDVDDAMLPSATVRSFIELLPVLLGHLEQHPDAPLADAEALLPTGFGLRTGARLINGNWLDLDRLAELAGQAPGVLAATAEVADDEPVLLVELPPGVTEQDLFDVHEYLLSLLHWNLEVLAPRVYRPLPGSGWPAGVPESGWRPAEAGIVLPPRTREERELCAAIFETHGVQVQNLALSYLAAGGQIMLSPAVGETLRRQGLQGLWSYHFASPCTLRTAARALVEDFEPAFTGSVHLV
jgi:hypothetical protein